jgi:hypothetical protein
MLRANFAYDVRHQSARIWISRDRMVRHVARMPICNRVRKWRHNFRDHFLRIWMSRDPSARMHLANVVRTCRATRDATFGPIYIMQHWCVLRISSIWRCQQCRTAIRLPGYSHHIFNVFFSFSNFLQLHVITLFPCVKYTIIYYCTSRKVRSSMLIVAILKNCPIPGMHSEHPGFFSF